MAAISVPRWGLWGRGPARPRRASRGLTADRFEAQERRRVVWMSLIGLASSFALAQAVINIGPAAVVIPLALLLTAAVIWQPRIGLYAVFTMVLLFEVISADPLMLPGQYFNYGLQSTLGVGAFIVSPLELLLILTLAIWLIQGLIRHRLDYRGGDLGWPVTLFFVAVLFELLRGAVGGGDTYIAFWEARSLLYVGVCYMLTANLVRTRRDIAFLIGACLIANGLYAIEAAYRDLMLVRTGLLDVPPEFLYSHEVVIFLAVMLLLAVILFVVVGPFWMRATGVFFAPIGMYALLATHRRAGYIALAIAFVVVTMPWIVRHRKALLLLFLPSVIAVGVYLPIFWNNTGTLGQPARAVRSLYEPDERDASSNDYRVTEVYNVRETIRTDPLLGVGFGQPFKFYIPLPDLSWWPFWHYEPHHNILWVWLKTGAVGFTIFWILTMGSLSIAASRALTLSDRTLVTFAYLALASLVITLIYCYVDLGLTYGRVTVFLGVMLGALAVMRRIDQEIIAAAPPVADAASTARRAARTGPSRPWSSYAAPPPPARGPRCREAAAEPEEAAVGARGG